MKTKAHTFTFDAAGWALESYITIEKYKDLDNHNQFQRINAAHELQRLRQIYFEFTGAELVVDYSESQLVAASLPNNDRVHTPISDIRKHLNETSK